MLHKRTVPSKRVEITQIRSLSSLDEEFHENANIFEERIRERTLSVIKHHNTNSSMENTLSIVEEQEVQQLVSVNALIYDSETIQEAFYPSINHIRPITNTECLWIEVTTLNKSFLETIRQKFHIHPLVMLDVETDEQRTKLDVFDDALFLVVKLIYLDQTKKKTHIEQISFYITENVIITFQRRPNDIFESVKNRIRSNKGRVRRSKIDYLLYLLLDTIVDRYMDVLDAVSTTVESIEHQLMKQSSHDPLETIYELKRQMLDYRRCISPLKEIILRLQKEEETQIVQDRTLIYLKDLFDHVVQVNDAIDTTREMLSSLIDFSMMLNSNRMNEVVKTLTIMSTIFIPLTFIAGVYGMNFENMPELRWKYGYFLVLGCMLSVTVVMLICFKVKKWF